MEAVVDSQKKLAQSAYEFMTEIGFNDESRIAETYNIGGFNEWKNIDLITYVTDRLGHDARYAIDSTKLQKELGGNHRFSLKKELRRL